MIHKLNINPLKEENTYFKIAIIEYFLSKLSVTNLIESIAN